MILFKKVIDLHKWFDAQQQTTGTIGFVPTMGALHEGHISLICNSVNANRITVSSIFVNPTQFNDPKDFQKYPVTIEKDIEMLEGSGCDILFLPSVEEMYPGGVAKQKTSYDIGYLENILEGKYRPGHFQGVCMVVHRLLDIVKPTHLFLGQKDYQQCMVIKKLLTLTGMESIQLEIRPTLREKDGLAMSSRNMRLNKEERQIAPAISHSLEMIKKEISPGKLEHLKMKAKKFLESKSLKIDYVEIADAADLTAVEVWDGKQKLVALVAAFLGEVRLIDNKVI